MPKHIRRFVTPANYRVFDVLNDINRWFEPLRLDAGDENANNNTLADWTPHIDIEDKPESYLIKADVPGVDPKDISVSMENGVLTLRGQKETVNEDKDYVRVERYKGSFMRRFNLPEMVDSDQIVAKCKHGVLEITIPKSKKTRSCQIKVEE